MNKRQKVILAKFILVTAVTAIAVVALINFKDWVNRSEAMRAMEQLGRLVINYRQEHGAVPSKSYVQGIKENLKGHGRLGHLVYRGIWVNLESTPEEILAYAERNYHSLLVGKGYVVLRLSGNVEWMEKQDFEALLARQQSRQEVEMMDNG